VIQTIRHNSARAIINECRLPVARSKFQARLNSNNCVLDSDVSANQLVIEIDSYLAELEPEPEQ
jgi:hypothetical protein